MFDRKSFGIKKYLANNKDDSTINEMLYRIKLLSKYSIKFWNVSLPVKRKGMRKYLQTNLLRNSKVICQWSLNGQYQPGWNTNQS